MSKVTRDLSERAEFAKKANREIVIICEEPHQRMGRMEEPRRNKDYVAVSSPSVEEFALSNGTTTVPTRKERKRTETMNLAFSQLRDHIPNVPTDTKLSKIKTLRLAISYIRYLMEILDGEEAATCLPGKRERNVAMTIASQCDTKEKRIKASEHECLPKQKRGRTGWPQKVWALELQCD